MRTAIIWLMVMAIAGAALADDVNTSPKGPVKNAPTEIYTPPAEVKVGGDTIDGATVILNLPYSDTGNTCNFLDNYDEACSEPATAPDVVYSFVPNNFFSITIDLCGSSYDTKVFVYDSDLNLVACNDEFYLDPICGEWTSKIEELAVSGSLPYYIVIDGFGSGCGEYNLNVSFYQPPSPCYLTCLPDAVDEGEPYLADDHEDTYNGECHWWPEYLPTYTNINWANTAAGEAWLCGVSGWYRREGNNYRDTDWFTATADGSGTMSFTVEPEYPCWIHHMTVDDEECNISAHEMAWVRCDYPVTITIPTTEDEVIYWLVLPLGWYDPDYIREFTYFATLTGHQWVAPVPTEEMSWGGVKAMYR